MKAPGLISARLALTTPYTVALSVSFTFTSPASPALTVSVEPSIASIGPRRRTVCGCCANVDETASPATKAAPASRRRVVLPMLLLRKWLRAVARRRHAQDKATGGSPHSHGRRNAVAADRDGGGFERAVILLVGGSDEDLRAGLELGLVTGDVGHNHRLRRDDDLLFSLLVLERDLVALHTLHDLRDGGVGHGAVGHQVPRPMTLASAAHRLWEDMNLHCLLAAVRLGHAGDPDERVVLDVGERCLDDAAHRRIVGQPHLVCRLPVARLDCQHGSVDGLDRAAHANRRWLLGKAHGCGKQQGKTGRAESAPCDLVHVVLPKISSPAKRPTIESTTLHGCAYSRRSGLSAMRPVSAGARKFLSSGIRKCERDQWWPGVAPPSTAMAVPWTCRARSEHRNSVSAAMSSGLPKRRALLLVSASARSSSTVLPNAAARCRRNSSCRSVSVLPGWMTLTLTLSRLPSLARPLEKLATAALTEPPIKNSASGVRAAPPTMLTTLPCDAFNSGQNSRVSRT